MTNLDVEFDWATVRRIVSLLCLIIFIYYATSHTKLNVT